MSDATDPNSIIHRPWRGDLYRKGVEGRRVMIVGNSHWLSKDEPDDDKVTEDVLGKVISGEYDIAFFNHIRDYFGFAEHADFWRRVVFLNYAPWAIGEGDDRYAHLGGAMIPPAKTRLVKVVAEHAPDVVFVFSKKIQWALPEMNFQDVDLPLPGARGGVLSSVASARIFLLRHTQGAPKRKMIETVAAILRLP
ncbi:hypothetical protein E0H47_10140 [Rhizobium leguminosarum bv. viciae]|uniref:hypothetical protein n=1 Tax=Rhizobium leguminosarum TaxID=384 RepID=UPI00103F9B76|nr:hypothetical protein [Rhizobium leguminosarum]TBZ41640.1 hypothetical protein E0H47_10140 [Rhizobium leguminosarum bv. viciae]